MSVNEGYGYEERIDPRDAGSPLLDYLCRRYDHSDRAAWAARIRDGAVTLDRRGAEPDEPLRPGQLLCWRRPPWREPEVPTDFEIIFQDAWLMAVCKPAGLPTLPAGGFLEHTLLRLLRREAPEATPMHRLGRHTSGLVLFARTSEARSKLADQWRRRSVGKHYLALASGSPRETPFPVDTPIGPVPHARLGSVHAADPAGRPAHSRVEVVERREGCFVARVSIVTGRPHQIRIHLAAAGYPLVGDPLYSAGGNPRDSTLPGDGGYHLHAAELELDHPSSGRRLSIACPPPVGGPLCCDAS